MTNTIARAEIAGERKQWHKVTLDFSGSRGGARTRGRSSTTGST